MDFSEILPRKQYYIFDYSLLLECVNSRWGDDCVNECTCIAANTDACDSENGDCFCNEGWSGNTCSVDVNECHTGSHKCNSTTETCSNTQGSYICNCKDGFRRHVKTGCQGWYNI